MKAIAKHDCEVTLYVSLESLSFNQMVIKKGDIIDFPIHKDEEITPQMAKVLGNRCVIFIDRMWYIPTFSKDFDYVEDYVEIELPPFEDIDDDGNYIGDDPIYNH